MKTCTHQKKFVSIYDLNINKNGLNKSSLDLHVQGWQHTHIDINDVARLHGEVADMDFEEITWLNNNKHAMFKMKIIVECYLEN